jgi:peptidoglycan/LPS O-acetylase OafA/YrhL
MTQTPNTSYLKQLDGLRFIAVSMVLIEHWTGETLGFPISYLGVCMFFVLSGFLITRILLQAKQKDATLQRSHGFSLKQFFIRRTVRIFPIYYLTIFVLFVLNVPPVREKLVWCLTYSTNIYNALNETWLGSIDHLWSLAVEEQFYLFFPFLVLFTPTRHLSKILLGFIVFSVGLRLFFFQNGTSWITPYVLMPTCLDAFGMGGLLAYFFFNKNEQFKAFVTNKIWLLVSLVLYVAVVIWGKQFADIHNVVTVVFLRFFESFLSLFLVANASYGFGGITKNILENKTAVYLGRISYGIYIYHNFVYNPYHSSATHPVVLVMNKLPIIAENSPLKTIFLYVITVALATISWFLIEKPINRWKDKFGY